MKEQRSKNNNDIPWKVCVKVATLALVLTAGLFQAQAIAAPVIQEVLYNPIGTDEVNGAEGGYYFTELFSHQAVDLTGWSLVGWDAVLGVIRGSNVYYFEAGTVINGIMVIGGIRVPEADYVDAAVDWYNIHTAVQLRDSSNIIIDAVQYGTGPFSGGEGTPTNEVTPGWSLSRDEFGTDTNDNNNDFTALSTPTPGMGPVAPEPVSSTLFIAGAATLGFRRFRTKMKDK